MTSRKVYVLLFLLLFVLALAQELPDFHVPYPFRFIVLWRYPFHRLFSQECQRSGLSSCHAQVAKEKPDFLVLTGDLVSRPSEADWQVWDRETEPWREAGIHVFPVLGNHDTLGSSNAPSILQPLP